MDFYSWNQNLDQKRCCISIFGKHLSSQCRALNLFSIPILLNWHLSTKSISIFCRLVCEPSDNFEVLCEVNHVPFRPVAS